MNYIKHGNYREEYEPDVTAVIPAYNAENFLARCINSLIYQTNINMEIIVVIDEGTTDGSEEIARAYTSYFPGKVFCIVKEGGGLSPARKMGMEHARAPYILFVDVDDYVDQKLCEVCFKLADEKKADIVSYNFAEYTTYKNKLIDYKAKAPLKTQSIEEAIEVGGIGWWKFMFSVCFLKENAHFYDMLWEDAGEIPALLSKAKQYIMTPAVLYYKINNNESMTETFPKISKRFLEHTLANKMTLGNVEKQYYSSACLRTAQRMIFPFFKFYSYYDHLVEHMKEYAWIYSFKEDIWGKLSNFQRNHVEKILSLPDPCIPLNIYINGFGKNSTEEYEEEAKKAFWNWENVFVLDESNCDLAANNYIKKAYEEGQYDYVAGYFAIQNIYDKGGVYVGDKLRLNNTLNSMRFNHSFWGFETDQTFTNQVFGARKNDIVVKEILKTYDFGSMYEEEYADVSKRIKTVLIAKCGIKFTGREQKGLFGAAVYPAMVFVVNANGQCNNISYVSLEDAEDTLTISRKVFEHIVYYQSENLEFFKLKLSKMKTNLDNDKPNWERDKRINSVNVNHLNNVIKDREQEILDIKNSFTYRVGYIVSYLPRKIYRSIFKKLIKR